MQTVAVTMIGAVIGGLAGYLFFTEEGRVWRRQIEPQIENLAREFGEFRSTLARASSVASEGWRTLHHAIEEGGGTEAFGDAYTKSSQAHPF